MALNHDRLMQLLDSWVESGWLRELDRALVRFLHQTCPDASPLLLLAAALASHQLGRGHVCLNLSAVLADSTFALALPPEGSRQPEIETPAQVLQDVTLPQWLAALDFPALVDTGVGDSPLVCQGDRLYLRRYWQYERQVEAGIQQRLAQSAHWRSALTPELMQPLLNILFSEPAAETANWQKLACALAAASAFSVITGGPGTGKTTTVVRLLALLQALEQQQRGTTLRIRLAAPTGKAAARLSESIAGALSRLPLAQLGIAAEAINSDVVTLHRLLGSRPDTRHFRHHPGNPLLLDVLVVDEASMVDLEMMAALLSALPPHARLILLGDKDQLASVEAGALLGELCQRAAAGHYLPATATWLAAVAGEAPPEAMQDAQGVALDQSIAMLRFSHRFGAESGIGQLAQAVNAGDVRALRHVWQQDYADLARLRITPTGAKAPNPGTVFRDWIIEGAASQFGARPGIPAPVGYGHYLRVMRTTRPEAGAPQSAFDRWAADVLEAFGQFQLLCAVRQGEWGVNHLNQQVAALLGSAGLLVQEGLWYAGRPVLVTRNDYSLGLMNGDIGIALLLPQPEGEVLRVAFPAGDGSGGVRWVLPGRLPGAETVFAMTVHKSQGSEFSHTALLLPESLSPILTRELIYTGITRARHWFSLGASEKGEQLLAQAIERQVLRSGGLTIG